MHRDGPPRERNNTGNGNTRSTGRNTRSTRKNVAKLPLVAFCVFCRVLHVFCSLSFRRMFVQSQGQCPNPILYIYRLRTRTPLSSAGLSCATVRRQLSGLPLRPMLPLSWISSTGFLLNPGSSDSFPFPNQSRNSSSRFATLPILVRSSLLLSLEEIVTMTSSLGPALTLAVTTSQPRWHLRSRIGFRARVSARTCWKDLRCSQPGPASLDSGQSLN